MPHCKEVCICPRFENQPGKPFQILVVNRKKTGILAQTSKPLVQIGIILGAVPLVLYFQISHDGLKLRIAKTARHKRSALHDFLIDIVICLCR